MSRAEEAAMKAYPINIRVAYGPLPGASKPCEYYENLLCRTGFQKGYEQAEKDLALTWEDIEEILIIDAELMEEARVNKKLVPILSHYEEILRRFNDFKSKKK